MTLSDEIATIQDRCDLVVFLKRLAEDLESNPDAWENDSLSRYLSALSAWIGDMDGYYANLNIPMPTLSWQMIGEILLAAKYYE